MKKYPRLLPLIVVVLALVVPGAAQSDFDPGVGVGTSIPHFELADPDGTVWTFDTLKGEQGLVLQFFRSADW